MLEFLMTVQPIIFRYKGSVTSWIRSADRNITVEGNPNSRHLFGWAVDVILDDPADNDSFILECHRQGLKAINEGDHIHVQTP